MLLPMGAVTKLSFFPGLVLDLKVFLERFCFCYRWFDILFQIFVLFLYRVLFLR